MNRLRISSLHIGIGWIRRHIGIGWIRRHIGIGWIRRHIGGPWVETHGYTSSSLRDEMPCVPSGHSHLTPGFNPGKLNPAIGAILVALSAIAGAAAGDGPAAGSAPHIIDCADNPRALWDAEPVIQHRDGHELHQFWLLADHPDLWKAAVTEPESLAHYRRQAREVVSDTRPLAMIRANRERFAWLERDYPAEGRINRAVEAGVGSHRPMNCLETQILAYQADRFPLFEQPSEIVALILRRSDEAGDLVKVYMSADDDSIPPMPNRAVTQAESEIADGWEFYGAFHNHTFSHSENRGHLPVAAPSASDVQVSVAWLDRLGPGLVLVSDGFSTIEVDPEGIRQLALAVEGPADDED